MKNKPKTMNELVKKEVEADINKIIQKRQKITEIPSETLLYEENERVVELIEKLSDALGMAVVYIDSLELFLEDTQLIPIDTIRATMSSTTMMYRVIQRYSNEAYNDKDFIKNRIKLKLMHNTGKAN